MELTAIDQRWQANLNELARNKVLTWNPLPGGNVEVQLLAMNARDAARAFVSVSDPAREMWFILRGIMPACDATDWYN